MRNCDFHRTVLHIIFNPVVAEIVDHLMQKAAHAVHLCLFTGDGETNALLLCLSAQRRRCVSCNLQKVNLLPFRRDTLVQLGEVDDVVHQRDQPRRLRADHAHKPGHVLRLDKPVFQ